MTFKLFIDVDLKSHDDVFFTVNRVYTHYAAHHLFVKRTPHLLHVGGISCFDASTKTKYLDFSGKKLPCALDMLKPTDKGIHSFSLGSVKMLTPQCFTEENIKNKLNIVFISFCTKNPKVKLSSIILIIVAGNVSLGPLWTSSSTSVEHILTS